MTRGGFFLVQVGSIHKGIVGRPQLYGDITVVKGNDWAVKGFAERLADLPALLD